MKTRIYSVYDSDDILVMVGTWNDIANRFNVTKGCISKCVNHNHKLQKKYTILFDNEYEDIKTKGSQYYCKPVDQYEDGKLIKHYKSLKEIEENGYSRYSVLKCCNAEIETYLDCTWRFSNENK